MKLEVLMSAMYQENFDIAYQTKIHSDLLIINQCDKEDYEEIKVDGFRWRMISTTERGLSKSRNMALQNAQGDICLFCDDDEELSHAYMQSVLDAYSEIPDAAAIVFNLNRINYQMKKTYYRISEIREAPWYRGYGSVQLSFKLAPIQEKQIFFNEKFGSGTEWGGGEDILFEKDIRREVGKIYEHPACIGTVDYADGSQWFHGYDEKYFYNIGAFVEYEFQKTILLKELRMLFTCYRLRREKKLSLIQKMKWMHLGARGIKKDVTYREFLENGKFDK